MLLGWLMVSLVTTYSEGNRLQWELARLHQSGVCIKTAKYVFIYVHRLASIKRKHDYFPLINSLNV